MVLFILMLFCGYSLLNLDGVAIPNGYACGAITWKAVLKEANASTYLGI
jgi:hypothetical protein